MNEPAMRLKFKIQPFQTEAVQSIVDCFVGQPFSDGFGYRIDSGKERSQQQCKLEEAGWRNADISLSEEQLLENIQRVQREQGLFISEELIESVGCRCNLDVEMETGTGKTYCYIKTIFELQKQYGWSKFIIVVPSIAIREGIYKTFQITSEHFAETYGKKARCFIYNSRELHNLERFFSDSGVSVMIINIQAFNATGKDNRRIYEEQEDFQNRRPIDVISDNRPILILDEPQKMEGGKTLEALKKFKPLMILRYSATHKTEHNKVHRLDAVDALNKKLVKKIAVRGISVKGVQGIAPYLFLDEIQTSPSQPPVLRMEMEVRQKNGAIARKLRRLVYGDNLFMLSGELNQYKGYVITDIDARANTATFGNGIVISRGEATGNVSDGALRQIQIREAVKAHLEKEKRLFRKGIKVLSLFFIDSVKKYRDYGQPDEKGEYAHVFEEEYARIVEEHISGLKTGDEQLKSYWQRDGAAKVHNGYFSVDKNKRLVDPAMKKRGEEAGQSDDVSAYDLILKDKERLLSFAEPVRFIFSHSALREGWDNPNVFNMCMLKRADSNVSRRQEVGRGLRLCVNQRGERIDSPAIVHDVNVLTVVTDESFAEYAENLQREICASLSARPRKADAGYFKGKTLLPLLENDYDKKQIRLKNDKFGEFKALWNKINHKAVFSVHFESAELVKNCIAAIDKELIITRAQYTVVSGSQQNAITVEQLQRGEAFKPENTSHGEFEGSARSQVRYDLIGKVAGNTTLTRRTIAAILTGIKPESFEKYAQNPEQFITEASRLINEQKATIIIERLSYDAIAEEFDSSIFTDAERNVLKSSLKETSERHIYDAIVTQSLVEKQFVEELEKDNEVIVYAKLPNGFFIPTPVGNYNPDWAIVFKEKDVKHIYFIAETKGSMSTMQLRKIEESKIDCAEKFFDKLNVASNNKDKVKYCVVKNYEKLMDMVKM